MSAPSSKAWLTLIFVQLAVTSAVAASADPAAAPPPVPASSAAAAIPVRTTALREIGHVRAQTAFCQTLFDDAGLSTKTALDNDATIIDTSTLLAHANLDEDAMSKPKTIWEMQRTYEALMARSKDAIGITKALRKSADDAPTPDQKAAIIAFADALGGVIYRQELDARDYRQYGVYLEAHDPVEWQDHEQDVIAQTIAGPHPGEMGYSDPRDRVTPFLADTAKAEATHLLDIHERVIDDEVAASSKLPAAIAPCQAVAEPAP